MQFCHWSPNRTKMEDRIWTAWNPNGQWFYSRGQIALAYCSANSKIACDMPFQKFIDTASSGCREVMLFFWCRHSFYYSLFLKDHFKQFFNFLMYLSPGLFSGGWWTRLATIQVQNCFSKLHLLFSQPTENTYYRVLVCPPLPTV